MPEPRKTKSGNLDLQQCASLGIILFLAMALWAFIGYWLDSWLHTKPVLLIVGCLLGLAAGMIYVVCTVNALQSRGRDDEPP